jgi:hypothetical protein
MFFKTQTYKLKFATWVFHYTFKNKFYYDETILFVKMRRPYNKGRYGVLFDY